MVDFGPFSFDLDAHLLTRGGETLPLKRQSAAVLAMLVDAGGSVVVYPLMVEWTKTGSLQYLIPKIKSIGLKIFWNTNSNVQTS